MKSNSSVKQAVAHKAGLQRLIGFPLILVGCLLPSLVSLSGMLAADSASRLTTTVPPHALAMHIHMVHLREVDIREGKAVARFEFHNAGDRPLKIRQIKPSCGCVTARIHQPDMGYTPGMAGEFYLEVDTASETAGSHEYDVKVDYYEVSAEEQPAENMLADESVQVVFRVSVPEKKVTVRPRALIFYQFSPEPTTQVVEVTDFRQGKNFEVLGLKLDDQQGFLKANGLKSTQNESGQRVWTFEVTAAGDVPTGRRASYVQMLTNDPEFPELRLPILLHGPPQKMPAQENPSATSLSPKTENHQPKNNNNKQ